MCVVPFCVGKIITAVKITSIAGGWVEERILAMQSVFCIDVCAYAVMSNHYHVVLHVDHQRAKALSAKEVLSRWLSL